VCFIIFFLFFNSVILEAKNKKEQAGKILKSSTSNLCWGSEARFFNQSKVETDESNVYDSYDDCVNDGGELAQSNNNGMLKEVVALQSNNEELEDTNFSLVIALVASIFTIVGTVITAVIKLKTLISIMT